jgi:gp6-like head-tail connector protein
MSQWPNLAEVRKLLRLQPDPNEDAVIQTALAAALEYGVHRMGNTTIVNPDGTVTTTPIYPADSTTVPDTAHEACLLHAARLYRRRDSLDGTIGFGDMGAIRVGRTDPDVDALYASLGLMVFG